MKLISLRLLHNFRVSLFPRFLPILSFLSCFYFTTSKVELVYIFFGENAFSGIAICVFIIALVYVVLKIVYVFKLFTLMSEDVKIAATIRIISIKIKLSLFPGLIYNFQSCLHLLFLFSHKS